MSTNNSQAIGEEWLPARDRAFLGASCLLFLASLAGTVYWCAAMQGGMEMPGGWTMSMAWMKMPSQSWPGAFASFVGMWTVMMAAMMLPSLFPMLASYRRSIQGADGSHLDRSTLLAGAGYFFAWAVFGAAAYLPGIGLAAMEMRRPALARSVPLAAGVAVLAAGCVQLTPWKARLLSRCRELPAGGQSIAVERWDAFQHGLRLGAQCGLCCLSFMTMLLVIGVMNLAAMAAVAVAINVERLAPGPARVSRATGFIAIAVALFMFMRTAA